MPSNADTESAAVYLADTGVRPRGAVPRLVDMAPYDIALRAVFNVKNYGAVGNGTAKDRDAILLAVAAAVANGGGRVFFPAGAYLNVATDNTTDSLDIPSNVEFVGAGREASTIHQPAFATLGQSFIRMIQADYARIAHIGLTSDEVEESKGISITDGLHCIIEDCYLTEGFGTGISFTGAVSAARGNLHNTCTRNIVEGTTREHSILLVGGSYNVISYNKVFDANACGIETWRDAVAGTPQENNQVIGNTIVLPLSHGITIHGDRGLIVSGNEIIDAGSHGINATRADYGPQTPCEDLLIVGNVISNAGRVVGGGMGITLSVAPGARVEGNTIQAARYRGIHTLAANTAISGNTIKNAVQGGVYVDNSNGTAKGCSVVDNDFIDCGGGVLSSGIELSDTNDALVAINRFYDTRAGAARCDIGVKIPANCDDTVVALNKATNLAGRVVDNASTTSHIIGHIGIPNTDRGTTARPIRRVTASATIFGFSDEVIEADTTAGVVVLTPDFTWVKGQPLRILHVAGANNVQLADTVDGAYGPAWNGANDNRMFMRKTDDTWARLD